MEFDLDRRLLNFISHHGQGTRLLTEGWQLYSLPVRNPEV